MKTSYFIISVLAHSIMLTVALFLMPFIGFLVELEIFHIIFIVAALAVARVVVFFIGFAFQMKGYGWGIVTVLLTVGLSGLAILTSRIVYLSMFEWAVLLVTMLITSVMTHGLLIESGSTPSKGVSVDLPKG